jgi:hypothetical protein
MSANSKKTKAPDSAKAESGLILKKESCYSPA